MSILDLYSYEENGVLLEFKFTRGDENISKKKTFLKLLQKAVVDLSTELSMVQMQVQPEPPKTDQEKKK